MPRFYFEPLIHGAGHEKGRRADESEATRTFDFSESYRRWRESPLGQTTDALEEALILDLLGPVQGPRILDVGCGDGVLAVALARRGARVTGLDADPRVLAATRRRAAFESVDVRLVLGVEPVTFALRRQLR